MGSIYPRRRRWWIKFRLANRRWRPKATPFLVEDPGGRDQAARVLEDSELAIHSAQQPHDPARPTVEEYGRRWVLQRSALRIDDWTNDESRLRCHVYRQLQTRRVSRAISRNHAGITKWRRRESKSAPGMSAAMARSGAAGATWREWARAAGASRARGQGGVLRAGAPPSARRRRAALQLQAPLFVQGALARFRDEELPALRLRSRRWRRRGGRRGNSLTAPAAHAKDARSSSSGRLEATRCAWARNAGHARDTPSGHEPSPIVLRRNSHRSRPAASRSLRAAGSS